MTTVPPLPHDDIADAIAGVSSIDELPPAVGVHTALGFRAGLGRCRIFDGRAQLNPKMDSTETHFNIVIFFAVGNDPMKKKISPST